MDQVKVINTKTSNNKESSTYVRPTTTITDNLQTNDKMEEKLVDYLRIGDGYTMKNIDDAPLNSHIRYVTQKDNKVCFRLGGFLKKKYPDYIVLTNNKVSWSVQKYHWNITDDTSDTSSKDTSDSLKEPSFTTIFFIKKTEQDNLLEIIETKNQIIDEMGTVNKQHSNTIDTLTKELEKQKSHCLKLIEIIQASKH